MSELSKKKVTIGELQLLPPDEQEKIIASFVEANQEQFKKVASAMIGASDMFKRIKESFAYLQDYNWDFLKDIKIPTTTLPNIDWPMTIDVRNYPLRDPNQPVTIRKSDKEKEKEELEAYAIKLQIQVLEQQLNLVKGKQIPQYDISTGILFFNGKSIQIPLNTNMEMICRIALKNLSNMAKRWSWDEIVEEARESTDNFTSIQIYTASRAVNEKVAQETAVKDFFITKPISSVRLNPKFVPK